MLTGLRFLHGAATAIFGPSALATVADMYRERRGAALGWYSASTQGGALLGPVLGGWLVYAAGFPTTFLAAGIFGCIGLLFFFSLRMNPPPPEYRDKGLGPVLAEMWKGFRVVAHNTRVLMTSATDAAKMIANGALMAFPPVLWGFGRVEPGRSRPAVRVPGDHLVLLKTGVGPDIRPVRPATLILPGL